ncbi:MAG TPA: hypothetical protein VMQ86_14070 [Bryobacteraceae bacterium]|jgi:hypothetical protein|nr:hypothetical protein [Bryobacteraceae bacterium]
MRFCRIAAVYVVCLSVWAGSGYTVEQIKQFITSAVQLKNPDKEVAETLRKMKLSERLDLDTVEALQNQGAGPKTVAVLKQLATESESLPGASPPPPKPVYVPPPPPSSEEQAKLLDEVRDYAVNYTKRLPDFICLEQTRRYVDTTGRESWRMQDIITARLSYFNQKEDYKLVSRNDKVITDVAYASVGGALSMGDFGTGMRDIFDPRSHAGFAWERWAKLRGRRTHVFSYRIPLEFSQYTIEYQGESKDDVRRITVGYHGSVFVDKEYNTIVRITQEADNIPPTFPVQEAKETLDYDFTKIGDSEFFLPLIATVRMHSGREWSKNEKEFRLYRKFSADSLIKFDDKDMPPLPDDKTKEQPPQSQPPK